MAIFYFAIFVNLVFGRWAFQKSEELAECGVSFLSALRNFYFEKADCNYSVFIKLRRYAKTSERPKQALSVSAENVILLYLVKFSINFDEKLYTDLTLDFKENLFYTVLL